MDIAKFFGGLEQFIQKVSQYPYLKALVDSKLGGNIEFYLDDLSKRYRLPVQITDVEEADDYFGEMYDVYVDVIIPEVTDENDISILYNYLKMYEDDTADAWALLSDKKLNDTDKFIDKAAIISVTDSKGRITYVNDKFEKVSGWKLEEVVGKDHSIVNSGTQPDGYWGKMYETVMKGEVWNDVVTNKAKDGSIYYVDTYIRARFDVNGKLEGFSSIRQDATIQKIQQEIAKSFNELRTHVRKNYPEEYSRIKMVVENNTIASNSGFTSLPNLNGGLSAGYKKGKWNALLSSTIRNSFVLNYIDRKDYQSSTELAYDYKDTLFTKRFSANGLLNLTYLGKNRYSWKTLVNYQSDDTYLTRNGDNFDNIQNVRSTSSNHINNVVINSQFDGKIKTLDFNLGYNYIFREQPDYRVNPEFYGNDFKTQE